MNAQQNEHTFRAETGVCRRCGAVAWLVVLFGNGALHCPPYSGPQANAAVLAAIVDEQDPEQILPGEY
jgi:hypothetical protein